MTNTPLENILQAENYIITLFIAVTNSLLIYSLIYGKKKWNGWRRQKRLRLNQQQKTFESMATYRKAVKYCEKHLKIAIEIGDRDGEGKAYGNPVSYTHLTLPTKLEV